MAKKGLGKGLDALFAEDTQSDNGVMEVKITDVMPNKNQPRKSFDEEKLEALSDSIKEHGVIQPIIVTKNGDFYLIVAGERRWRAAKKAGIKKIPVIVRDYDDLAVREIALIENLQREDLNPIEEALGYRALMDEYNFTQEEISVVCEGETGKEIAFNGQYITEVMRNLDEEEIYLCLTSSVSPCVIRPVSGGDEYTYMVLPVRVYV